MRVIELLKILGISNLDNIYEAIDKNYKNIKKEEKVKLIRHINYRLSCVVGGLLQDREFNKLEMKEAITELLFGMSGSYFKGLDFEDEEVRLLRSNNPRSYCKYYCNKIKNEFPNDYEELYNKYEYDYGELIDLVIQGYTKVIKNNSDQVNILKKLGSEISHLYDYFLRKRNENSKYSIETLDKIIHGSLLEGEIDYRSNKSKGTN